MKIKLLVGGLVFLIIINLVTIGTFLYLQFNKSDHRFKYRAQDSLMIPPFLHSDNRGERLSKEQREKLFGLFDKFRKETKDVNEEIRVTQEEIKDILMSETVNELELNEKMQKIADLRLDISTRAVKNIIEAKSFLTGEQIEHFVRAIMQFRPQHRRGFGPPTFKDFRMDERKRGEFKKHKRNKREQ